jgi:hypothetical protein
MISMRINTPPAQQELFLGTHRIHSALLFCLCVQVLGAYGVKLVSSKAGDEALKTLVSNSESNNTMDLLSDVWDVLCSHKTLPRDQSSYWALISYTCEKYDQLCAQYLRTLPLECGQFQELLPVEKGPEMVTGTAYGLNPKEDTACTDVEALWGLAVQRQFVLGDNIHGCAKQWMAASELPLGGLARASTVRNPSLLRLLIATESPSFVFGLTAGEK